MNEVSLEKESFRQVGEEMQRNEIDKGLYTKAVMLSEGNQSIVQSIYIKLRAEELSNNKKNSAKRQGGVGQLIFFGFAFWIVVAIIMSIFRG